VTAVNAEKKVSLRERKKQRTRAALVEAAIALFAEQGYDATTTAQIAEAAEFAPRMRQRLASMAVATAAWSAFVP
jgi:hypothetical protein